MPTDTAVDSITDYQMSELRGDRRKSKKQPRESRCFAFLRRLTITTRGLENPSPVPLSRLIEGVANHNSVARRWLTR